MYWLLVLGSLITERRLWPLIEGAGGGQRVLTLSTGRAGARKRIVHMPTACLALSPAGELSRCGRVPF